MKTLTYAASIAVSAQPSLFKIEASEIDISEAKSQSPRGVDYVTADVVHQLLIIRD